MGEVGVGQATAKPGPRHLSSQMGRRSEKNKSAWLAIAQRRCNSCVIDKLAGGGTRTCWRGDENLLEAGRNLLEGGQRADNRAAAGSL